MEYYFLNIENQQNGPYTIEELKTKSIDENTKVWCQGMNDWSNAKGVPELQVLFVSVPPPPPSTVNTPPPSPVNVSYTPQQNTSNNYEISDYGHSFSSKPVYDQYFDIGSLNGDELNIYKKHYFFDTFSTGVGILLHYLTLGIFTTIYCGSKHSKLPIIKDDDFGGGKAIGLLFIPLFNLYWLFVFWRKLAFRLNFQFKLRNQPPQVSVGLATTACILTLIPYIGSAINYLVLGPILFAQVQSASNKLAKENINHNMYNNYR